MDVTIMLGTWAIPAAITIGSFLSAMFVIRREEKRRGGFNFGVGILGLTLMAGASIASLVAWLVWALLR